VGWGGVGPAGPVGGVGGGGGRGLGGGGGGGGFVLDLPYCAANSGCRALEAGEVKLPKGMLKFRGSCIHGNL
jgi:hypothetical protein